MIPLPLSPQAPHETVDELYDFFDFFDRTVNDVHSYILHCTRVPELASDTTLSVYFSLLQRRRVYFWKNVTELPTLFALADKAIGSMQRWEEEAAGISPYLEELLRCAWDGKEKGALERMRLLLQALKKLPLRERKIAVLQFFLGWSSGKTALMLGKPKESVERDYQMVENLLTEQLQQEQTFQGTTVRDVLRSLHCPPLEESRKTALRLALLQHCRSAQMSSLRFVFPVASFLLIAGTLLGCVFLFATFLLPTLSAESTLQQIAAAEVLLLSHERETSDAFLQAEDALHGIAASYALEELIAVNTELAALAVKQQAEEEKQVEKILRELSPFTFLSHREISLIHSPPG